MVIYSPPLVHRPKGVLLVSMGIEGFQWLNRTLEAKPAVYYFATNCASNVACPAHGTLAGLFSGADLAMWRCLMSGLQCVL